LSKSAGIVILISSFYDWRTGTKSRRFRRRRAEEGMPIA